MAVVSALKPARSGGVAVYLDGSYVCTVSQALIARWPLFVGRQLSNKQAEQLSHDAAAERALADAHRLLGHRLRSHAELAARLRARGHDERATQTALQSLAERGLLNDEAFARAFVADKRRLAGWGRQRIAAALDRLGVAAEVAWAALNDEPKMSHSERQGNAGSNRIEKASRVEAEDAELRRALQVLSRVKLGAPLQTLERRAYQLLIRRGFSTSVAYDAVRQWAATLSRQPEDDQYSTR
jgi:SOS response regulatory protein OraA/RecX